MQNRKLQKQENFINYKIVKFSLVNKVKNFVFKLYKQSKIFDRFRKNRRFFLKSQIQMGESIAILFIFFILVVFGFVFYMNIMKSSAKVEIEENIQLKAIGIAQKASFLPELQCSEENVRVEDCIDVLKLEFASGLLEENNIYYYDLFEFSNITVKRIFPPEIEKTWHLYNNTLTGYRNKLSTFIPVSLFNPDSKKYDFGILTVEVYIK